MSGSTGKSRHKGVVNTMKLMEMFPDEQIATEWFEAHIWPEVRCCGHCGSIKTSRVPKANPMPYWCKECRKYFSVRTGTALSHTRLPLRKWAVAIYMEIASRKGISSVRLHEEIGVTQKTAWYMLHRIREAWKVDHPPQYAGPVEVDETYVGGKRANMSNAKRKRFKGRGTEGKTAVVGIKDRRTNRISARVVKNTDASTLQGFVIEHVAPGGVVFTDDAAAYHGLPFPHMTVRHSAKEYVRGEVHTNGIESFWATVKRAQKGVFHKLSPKHLNRYIQGFVGKHNVGNKDTLAQMIHVVAGMIGRRLSYKQLIARNGFESGARPMRLDVVSMKVAAKMLRKGKKWKKRKKLKGSKRSLTIRVR